MSVDSFPQTDEMSVVTLTDVVEESQFSQRVLIRHIIGLPDGGAGMAGQKVRVGRWVKTGHEHFKGSFAFLELNDGSCPTNIQVVVDAAVSPLGQLVPTGTCVHVEGELKVPLEGTMQWIELRVHKVLDVGTIDPAKYRLPKSRLTLEFLRDYVHLRLRTNTMSYCDWKCHPE
ncbi:asparagine--tRNA ligase [Sarracenia purpurea var. burkii]